MEVHLPGTDPEKPAKLTDREILNMNKKKKKKKKKKITETFGGNVIGYEGSHPCYSAPKGKMTDTIQKIVFCGVVTCFSRNVVTFPCKLNHNVSYTQKENL